MFDQNVIGRLDIQQEDDGDDVPVITAPNRIISKCQDILINSGLSAEDSAIHSKFQELIRSIDANDTNGAAQKIVDKLIEGGLCMSLCPDLAAAFCKIKRRVKASRGAHVSGGAVSSKPQKEFTDRSGKLLLYLLCLVCVFILIHLIFRDMKLLQVVRMQTGMYKWHWQNRLESGRLMTNITNK